MNESLAKHYLEDAISNFRAHKKQTEKALSQVKDEELFQTLDEEGNSIAVIIKHIVGNMFSRWTDFLTTDGEKPDRNRDMEFVVSAETSREDLLKHWERGWNCLFAALEPLQPEDVMRKVYIRGKEHTVVEAINRQLTHYAEHIGQIIFLAKHFRAAEWQTLSIPRNKSAEFNAYLATKGGDSSPESRAQAPLDFIKESKNKQESGVRSQETEEKENRI
ncbi:MAG: hypothetical protein QOC96_2268 [Acidobacteriota bacterium]|jgi:hypothetical protein|nr:hypothetical protein [Acidobacteriota bacterium]